VHKKFLGGFAKERFENEVRVLKYLEKQGCKFVPQVIEANPETLYLVTRNCGNIVEEISERKLETLFHELEQYGVKHGDPFKRNVTYSPHLGRFCIIDFEFATLMATGEGLTLEEVTKKHE
jgi:tRNA A-37 threonylcarbamoyl transferase component Bud32